MSLIVCKNLSFAYDSKIVLSNINFELKQGEYLCILGENGAGKSTLMKGLLGLKSPASGSYDLGDGLKTIDIGYLPQQTQVQKDFPASVYEVVISGCLNDLGCHLFYSKAHHLRAESIMEELGITQLKDRCYRELSGGQQQRVLLARALCATHKLLLLDEPVTGLDPVVSKELYDIIRKLNKERNISIIMISHDINGAVDDATNVLHLGKQGQLFYGSVNDYKNSDLGKNFLERRAL